VFGDQVGEPLDDSPSIGGIPGFPRWLGVSRPGDGGFHIGVIVGGNLPNRHVTDRRPDDKCVLLWAGNTDRLSKRIQRVGRDRGGDKWRRRRVNRLRVRRL
jgi:hypothetical protein